MTQIGIALLSLAKHSQYQNIPNITRLLFLPDFLSVSTLLGTMSSSNAYSRQSTYNTGSSGLPGSAATGSYGAHSTSSVNRARQHAHLHAQLATLNARLADTENLLRMTAVQAEYIRGLGGYMGAL